MTNKWIMLLLAFVLSPPIAAAEDQKPKDTLVIAISSDFEPFTFLNAEGKPAGMFVDIWRLWAQKTGKQIEFITSDWKTSLENLKNQKADIHSGFLYSPKHFEWISGSALIYESGVSLFYPLKQGKLSDIKELSGQTVAVLGGSQLEQFLKKNYPDIRVLACDTREELVKVSRNGKANGFVAIRPVGSALIDRMGLSGEFEMNDEILYKEKFLFGVLKKNTELLGLVDKGLNEISHQERAEIEARWIPDPTKRYYKTSNIIQLTPAEEVWIRNHKTIRLGIAPVMPPLKFFEKDVIKGIEPDYINLLSEFTGINFQLVVCDFKDMDTKVKSAETDMFLSVYVPERFEHMMFTKPFMDFDQVIVTRSDAPFVTGIDSLKVKKVAVLRGLKLHEKILASYPEIETVRVDTMEQMFQAVSEGNADALISKIFLAAYIMHQYPNLKIAGIADIPRDPYYYAVRKDYPELVSILNKAIQSIPNDRVNAIVQKWFSVQIEYRPNWTEILKWAFVIGGAFTLLLGLSLLWNRRLSREIDKRKQAEDALRQNEYELQEKNAELTRFTYAVSHDLKSPLVTILAFLGYLENDIQNQDAVRTKLDMGYIRNAAEKMGRLLDELRDLSRIGRVKNDPVEIPLQEIVQEALTLVAGRIAEKNVQIQITEDPIILFCDRSRLVEVFQNLIDNAVKFMGDQAAPHIAIGAQKSGDEIILFVRDCHLRLMLNPPS